MTESGLREHSTPVLLRSAEDSEAQPLSFFPPDTPRSPRRQDDDMLRCTGACC